MTRRHLRTYGELEQRIDAARQLRAETIASAMRTFAAVAGETIRSLLVRTGARAPRRFPVATDRTAPTPHGRTVWN